MALSIGELVGYIDLDTSAAEGAAGKLGGVLEGAGGKWGKILGGAGLAAGTAFAGAVFTAMGNEVGSDRLAASLGKGSKAAEQFGDIAGRVYANGFGAGLDDVNTAMGAVITSIKGMRTASDGEVQAMTEKAMTFADVMQVDVTRAAQVAGNMVYNGLAKDGSEAFDLLMKASQKVPVQLREDVLDATDEYGQFFTQLGIDGPEAMALLAKGAEKGMYGIDKAGDAIKEFTIRATDGSKSTATTFEAIGLNAKNMSNDLLAGGDKAESAFNKTVDALLKVEDPTQRAADALALFGTPLEDLGTKDIPGFLKSLQTTEGGLGKFKGAVDKAGETAYDNASTNLSMFGRALKTGFVDLIGGSVLPKLTEWTGVMSKELKPVIELVVDWVQNKLAPTLKDAGENLFPKLRDATAGLGEAFNDAKPFLQLVGDVLTNVVIPVVETIIGTTWPMMIKAIGLVATAAGKLAEWFRIAFDKIRDVVQSVGSFFTEKLPQFFQDAWQKAKDWTSAGVDKVVGWVQGVPGKITGALSSLTETVRGLFRDAMDAGKEKVTGIGGTIVGWIEGIPGKILTKLQSFKDAGAGLLQGFVDGMKNAAGVIEGIAGNVWTTVKGLLNGAIDKINAGLDFTISLPGKDLHIDIPNIPQLATGGRATASTLAVIGEGREPESVLPDSVLRGLLERAHAAGAAQRGGGNGRNAPLIEQVVQRPGESADELAERLWFITRTRG